ncbi:MAG: hypothetical protein GYB49_12795 [Alphaproteobacteria bacterium]|jgi:hypothetical protein|nr:hypothetical protein [Hyphomonas sp.]MBR9808087.1 hypothetical protein [Alphaproteobacteria bacterium]|tara:strand:+ start:824 stop:1429 length:606 start_codon:yes stop_codon:yes gene_type:complete
MGNGNKAEMLIAICAVLTSVIALFVAWDQGRVMRAQQHGSVYPVLQVDGFVSSTPTRRSLGLRLSNSGVGPALIESVTLLEDGEPIDGFESHRESLPPGYDLSWSGATGRALAPDQMITPVEVAWPVEVLSEDDFYEVAGEWDDLALEICYCSVFERCWKLRGIGTARAERVQRCERSDRDIFEELRTPAPSAGIETPEVE